ncbi:MULTISPECIES: hypothetical protein [Lactococcus]|jgi:hypothetical protein|uniref:Uncharacterized protein n=1 Tax=Lactococcus formosensis TaxID=1281486 RepID=A0A9Q9D7K0_9LACT|nr:MULTISPECIES: hypothetical protein [Lactococcus]USI66498.1 hypothetical protein LMK05_04265 [Lactococcus petauri]USI68942.1 hypothetical protein LMK04_04195 [Lactococcus petauri]USJ21129.1 hypothetical protein LMK00_03765 [Lactococcus formosensis]WJE13609.1 hypothetical protein QR692_04165 [Lactococcus petauri]
MDYKKRLDEATSLVHIQKVYNEAFDNATKEMEDEGQQLVYEDGSINISLSLADYSLMLSAESSAVKLLGNKDKGTWIKSNFDSFIAQRLKELTQTSYSIASPAERIDYAELLFDVTRQTDEENWEYFREEEYIQARDFLNYGYYSRVIMARAPGEKHGVPVGYIQVRILKAAAPQLLYKDFYHKAGLSSVDLWEKCEHLKEGSPVYIDVIAVKRKYQNNKAILNLIHQAMVDILRDIFLIEKSSFNIFAVGVTNKGRKMCQLLGMEKLSEVERGEGINLHTRTLFSSNINSFEKQLVKLRP